jgi:site-specific DNA recombinase
MKSTFSQAMPLPSNIRCAAIYARVSTEDQGKGFSIPTQIDACQKLAEREGYTVLESHILVDEGISGTTMDRPGLRQVREFMNTQAIAAVIVYDPDRLSRNLGHQLLLAEEFERAGVKLLIVSHPLEQGPEGWLFFQMRGALAEYERAKIQERTQRGRMGRAKAGHVWGGEVKLGYRAVREPHKAFWVVEEDAALVRRIFQMALEGMSQWAIAGQLTREHLLTCRDRRGTGPKRRGAGVWTPSTVHRILTYEGYTGRCFTGSLAACLAPGECGAIVQSGSR